MTLKAATYYMTKIRRDLDPRIYKRVERMKGLGWCVLDDAGNVYEVETGLKYPPLRGKS